MKQYSKQRPKQELSYLQSLKKGALIALFIGILISFFLLLSPLTTWTSIDGPPSGAIHIVEAGRNTSTVRVEANDGNIYRHVDECVYTSQKPPCPIGWLKEDDYTYDPDTNLIVERGNDCQSLRDGFFPLNPRGKIIECTKTYRSYDPHDGGIYFALSTDGTLQYYLGLSNPNEIVILIIAIFLIVQVIMAIIVSVNFWIKTLSRK